MKKEFVICIKSNCLKHFYTMSKLYVYLFIIIHQQMNKIRQINAHIVFRHIKAFLISTFADVTKSYFGIIRKVFVFTRTNIIVFVGILSMLITQLTKKDLSSNPRFVSKINAMSTTDNIVQHLNYNRYIVLTGSFGI